MKLIYFTLLSALLANAQPAPLPDGIAVEGATSVQNAGFSTGKRDVNVDAFPVPLDERSQPVEQCSHVSFVHFS